MPDVTILHVVNREAEEAALYPLISIGIGMFSTKKTKQNIVLVTIDL